MADESLHVAVVDIGRLENLGWVVEGPFITESGTDIDLCIEALAKAISTGALALGFEAPMFVPYGRSFPGNGKKESHRRVPLRSQAR